MIHIVSNQPNFCMELTPNKSGTLRGIHFILGFLLCLFIPVGLVFTIFGAWPVFGFMGAELGLLYLAFRCNQKDTQTYERLSLKEGIFLVERHDPWRGYQTWKFEPQWLRVKIDRFNEYETHLTLNSKGKKLSLGNYLTSDEKSTVAEHLMKVFNRVSFLHS